MENLAGRRHWRFQIWSHRNVWNHRLTSMGFFPNFLTTQQRQETLPGNSPADSGCWRFLGHRDRKQGMRKPLQTISRIQTQTCSWQFFVTCLGWISDPLKWLSDLQLGDEKVTLNHLAITLCTEQNGKMSCLWHNPRRVYGIINNPCMFFSMPTGGTGFALQDPPIDEVFFRHCSWKYIRFNASHYVSSHLSSRKIKKSPTNQPTKPKPTNQTPLISSEISSVFTWPKWPQRSMISACETNDGANFKLKRCRNVSWLSVEMDSTLT